MVEPPVRTFVMARNTPTGSNRTRTTDAEWPDGRGRRTTAGFVVFLALATTVAGLGIAPVATLAAAGSVAAAVLGYAVVRGMSPPRPPDSRDDPAVPASD